MKSPDNARNSHDAGRASKDLPGGFASEDFESLAGTLFCSGLACEYGFLDR